MNSIQLYKDMFLNSAIPLNIMMSEIDKISDINMTDYKGENLLYWCWIFCRDDYKPILLKYIIDKGIDIDNYDENKETVLTHSCKGGDLETVKILVQHGANVNHTDYSNDTALLWASYFNHVDIVKFLVDNGADVNHTYVDGKNSIMWASKRGNIETMQVLIEYTTDLTRLDVDNNDIYDLAYTKEIRLFLIDYFFQNKIFLCYYFHKNKGITKQLKEVNLLKKIIHYYSRF